MVHMLPASVGVTVTDGVESHYYQQQKQMQKKPMSCCKVGVHIVCVVRDTTPTHSLLVNSLLENVLLLLLSYIPLHKYPVRPF